MSPKVSPRTIKLWALGCLALMMALAACRPVFGFGLDLAPATLLLVAAGLGCALYWGGRAGRGCVDAVAWSLCCFSALELLFLLFNEPSVLLVYLLTLTGSALVTNVLLFFLLFTLPAKVRPESPELTWQMVRDSSYLGYFVGLLVAGFLTPWVLPGSGPDSAMEAGLIWLFHVFLAGVVLVIWITHHLLSGLSRSRHQSGRQ